MHFQTIIRLQIPWLAKENYKFYSKKMVAFTPNMLQTQAIIYRATIMQAQR